MAIAGASAAGKQAGHGETDPLLLPLLDFIFNYVRPFTVYSLPIVNSSTLTMMPLRVHLFLSPSAPILGGDNPFLYFAKVKKKTFSCFLKMQREREKEKGKEEKEKYKNFLFPLLCLSLSL